MNVPAARLLDENLERSDRSKQAAAHAKCGTKTSKIVKGRA